VGELTNTNLVTHRSFWVGVYPGLTVEMLEYVGQSFREFLSQVGRP
jgi:dTDP-4-amino-4,6-dideoxygalactose transaminase